MNTVARSVFALVCKLCLFIFISARPCSLVSVLVFFRLLVMVFITRSETHEHEMLCSLTT